MVKTMIEHELKGFASALRSLAPLISKLNFEEKKNIVLKAVIELRAISEEFYTVFYTKDSAEQFCNRFKKILEENPQVKNLFGSNNALEGFFVKTLDEISDGTGNVDIIIIEDEDGECVSDIQVSLLCKTHWCPVLKIY